MIALEHVSILKPGFARRDPILVDASATFRRGERTGILAAPGSGKSSIARVLSGIERPDRGHVRSVGPVSWPIGFAGFLHPQLGIRDNLSIYSRLMGIAADTVASFCVDFCGIDGLLHKKMADLTPTQRAMLAYACALSSSEPAMWIADEVITIGEPRDRKRCDDLLADRLDRGGLVFLSRNTRQLKLYCDRFFVLLNNRLVPCDDPDVGQEALEIQTRDRGLAVDEVFT